MSELKLESNWLAQEKRHGRGLLLLLLAMFSLPLLIVGAMYQFHWHPDGGSHGQLHRQWRRPLHRQRRAGGCQRADQERAFSTDDDHSELRRQRRA